MLFSRQCAGLGQVVISPATVMSWRATDPLPLCSTPPIVGLPAAGRGWVTVTVVSIRALIWDFDGVIIDSEGADCQAWREQFALAGAPVTVAAYARFWAEWSWHRKVRMVHQLAALSPDPVNHTAVEARRLARYRELCADLPARPGVARWLRQARELGITCAVATNDDTGRTRAHLARLGLDTLISAVVTAGDGIARKPAPDLYLAALDALGIPASRAAAIEDSPHGIAAAQAAGLATIAMPHPVSAALDLTGADLIVADAAGMPLDQAIARLAG
jgi:HAD superfamily hydrolase (TIGR01509 family)